MQQQAMILKSILVITIYLLTLISSAAAQNDSVVITFPTPIYKGWTFLPSDGDLNGDGQVNYNDCIYQVVYLLTSLMQPWCDDRAPEGYRTCGMLSLNQYGLPQARVGDAAMMPPGPDGIPWCFGQVYGVICLYCKIDDNDQDQLGGD